MLADGMFHVYFLRLLGDNLTPGLPRHQTGLSIPEQIALHLMPKGSLLYTSLAFPTTTIRTAEGISGISTVEKIE